MFFKIMHYYGYYPCHDEYDKPYQINMSHIINNVLQKHMCNNNKEHMYEIDHSAIKT